jgi:hypothetical protein
MAINAIKKMNAPIRLGRTFLGASSLNSGVLNKIDPTEFNNHLIDSHTFFILLIYKKISNKKAPHLCEAS